MRRKRHGPYATLFEMHGKNSSDRLRIASGGTALTTPLREIAPARHHHNCADRPRPAYATNTDALTPTSSRDQVGRMITIIAPRDYAFLHTLPNMAINQSEIAPALNPARSCLVGSRTSTRALHFPALGFSLTVQYTDPCEISFQISPALPFPLHSSSAR